MSFKMIEYSGPGSVARHGVAMSAKKQGGKFIVRLRFAPDILKAMHWAPGCYLGLAYGHGEDTGKLRIKTEELSGYKLYKGSPRDLSKFLQCSRIGDGKRHRSQPVPHKIIDDCLYITLPDWARPADQ